MFDSQQLLLTPLITTVLIHIILRSSATHIDIEVLAKEVDAIYLLAAHLSRYHFTNILNRLSKISRNRQLSAHIIQSVFVPY